MRLIIALLLFVEPLGATDLIPKPRRINLGSGQLLVDVQTAVIAPASLKDHAGVIATAIQKTTGFLHRIRTPEEVGQMVLNRPVKLSLAKIADHQGFYRLEITPGGVILTANDRVGLMHGAQTFANLLPVDGKSRQRALIPCQTIEDWPETPRRIFHLDVGAHLFPVDDLKSLMDWLSFHKLNEFHLQLNNDHGWRMESKKFPQLHLIGGIRKSTPPYGNRFGSDNTEYKGHYTQENLKDLVAYAQSRAVRIVPSFALTTGASAILAAYPDLGESPIEVAHTWEAREIGLPDNERTLEFVDALFTEVTTVFPDLEIRLEGPRTDFHDKVKKLLTSKNRTLLIPDQFTRTDLSLYQRPGYTELLLAPKLEAEGGFNSVRDVYKLSPSQQGAEATLRTQFVHDFAKLQYMTFPRLSAFAETAWLPPALKDYPDFRNRLEDFDSRYRRGGVRAGRAYDPPLAKTKYGVKATSSIKFKENHPPALVFDDREDSFFWSEKGLKPNDHLTLEFPWPLTGTVSLSTGLRQIEGTILEEGMLEISTDGKRWDQSEAFIAGEAAIEVVPGTRFVRLRSTSSQPTPLIVSEFTLSEAMLTPLHEEKREIQIPFRKDPLILTFKADFRNHPELRETVQQAREIYFSEWLPLAQKIGVSQMPETPRVFELKPGEPGVLGPKEIQLWMLRRMAPWLQNYPVTAPLWFTSGFTALLLEDLPENPDPSLSKEGGRQTAAFLDWVAKKHGNNVLTVVSQDCRRAQYRPKIWKTMTGKSLAQLAEDYEEQAK